jgi:hypothetical protein
LYLCNSLYTILLNNHLPPIFGLDFNSSSSTSSSDLTAAAAGELHLGGVPAKYNSSILWTNNQLSAGFNSKHQFVMSQLQLGCGGNNNNNNDLNLFGRYGSTWPTIVDTGSNLILK